MGYRSRSQTPGAFCLFVAFVLLLLTVISAPITKFSSIGSASGVKFGVFGYCTATGACSGVSIGYDTDRILRGASGGTAARPPSAVNSSFNLPSGVRNGLTNLLIVHVVACGITLILFLLTMIGHVRAPSHSSKYLLFICVLSLPATILSLLAFLVDILIFVPNLDWGTWITLAATIFNALAGVLICTGRRRMNARKAVRARVSETDEMSGAHYYNAQHMHENALNQVDKGTLPRFAEFETVKPGTAATMPAVDSERSPLNRLSPNHSPNQQHENDDASQHSNHYNNANNLNGRRPPPQYANIRTSPGREQQREFGSSAVRQEPGVRLPYNNTVNQGRSDGFGGPILGMNSAMNVARPMGGPPVGVMSQQRLLHPGSGIDPRVMARRMEAPTPVEEATIPSVGQSILDSESGYGDVTDHGFRGQGYVVPSIAGMPPSSTGATLGRREQISNMEDRAQGRNPQIQVEPRKGSGSYYEDADPVYDEVHQHIARMPVLDEFADTTIVGNRRAVPSASLGTISGINTNRARANSFERPPYPQQPRSPAASTSSHFTSVSQRGVNPRWQPDIPGTGGVTTPNNFARTGRIPESNKRRVPDQMTALSGNPDFELPIPHAGPRKLPGAKRGPSSIPGLQDIGRAGDNPYAVARPY